MSSNIPPMVTPTDDTNKDEIDSGGSTDIVPEKKKVPDGWDENLALISFGDTLQIAILTLEWVGFFLSNSIFQGLGSMCFIGVAVLQATYSNNL